MNLVLFYLYFSVWDEEDDKKLTSLVRLHGYNWVLSKWSCRHNVFFLFIDTHIEYLVIHLLEKYYRMKEKPV